MIFAVQPLGADQEADVRLRKNVAFDARDPEGLVPNLRPVR